MGHNAPTCMFANAIQQSSSIATPTGTQIWPYHKKVKAHHSLIILTKLVDIESPMLYTKIQSQSTGEEDFLSVLPYMGMAAILFNDAELFE